MICVVSLLILHSSFFIPHSFAQQLLTDHDWYLAGERMTVAVEAASTEQSSKVAYVELCDTQGLQASTMLWLDKGRGQAVISLPSTLHSGCYQLSMYTRMGTKPLQRIVPVINIMQKSADDNITWIDSTATSAVFSAEAMTQQRLPENLPLAQRREHEGHCIYARIRRTAENLSYAPSQINATLSVVGNEVHIFDGRVLDDTTVVFNTFGVSGRHSIVIYAETFDKKPLPVEIINPFVGITPQQLPPLTFYYDRTEIEKRSLAMQMAAADTMLVDSTVFVNELLNTKPVLSYNLDEYRQFSTIREALLEYVQFVHRTEKYGMSQLYVYNEAVGFSDWPALVIIDGMPVYDIERLLRYDARRVHYISIYDDYYTFGSQLYKGIINIVTRTGKLTNFPPEKTAAYLIYNFPGNG